MLYHFISERKSFPLFDRIDSAANNQIIIQIITHLFRNTFPLDIRNEDAATDVGVTAFDDHDAQSSRTLIKLDVKDRRNFLIRAVKIIKIIKNLFEGDDAEVFESRVSLFRRLFLQGNGKSSDGRDGHFLEGSFPPQDDDGDAGSADGFDDGRGVEVTPPVQDVAVDFDQLVAHLETAVLEGDAARIETADENGHDGAILVSGQTEAQTHRRQGPAAGRRPVQIDSNNFALEVSPFLMDFLCSKNNKQPDKNKKKNINHHTMHGNT